MLTDIYGIVCHPARFLKRGLLCLFLVNKPRVSCPFGSSRWLGCVAQTERSQIFQLLPITVDTVSVPTGVFSLSVSNRFPLRS